MPLRQTARRYARAWFDLARAGGHLEATGRDVDLLDSLWHGEGNFAAFCGQYLMRPDRRRAILAAMFEGRVQPLTFRFLRLLEAQYRLARLGGILEEYRRLADSAGGVVRATVTTAVPADEGMRGAATAALQRHTGAPSLAVEWREDPALIGGARMTVEDLWIDSSVAGRLARLRRAVGTGE